MSYTQIPWIRHGQLLLVGDQLITLDTPAWFAWLSQTASFYYVASYPVWRLSVRHEKRRQQFYWYAYSRIDGKLHNIYLGKQDTLTTAYLEQACLLIHQRARQRDLRNERSQQTAA